MLICTTTNYGQLEALYGYPLAKQGLYLSKWENTKLLQHKFFMVTDTTEFWFSISSKEKSIIKNPGQAPKHRCYFYLALSITEW